MKDLLFLSHRIPYPPDKGDKIRSFHWLKGLSAHFRVHLGTFIDDSRDEQYVEAVQGYCQSMHVGRLGRYRLALGALPAVMRREALSLAMYRDAGLANWVEKTCRDQQIDTALAFSAGVAPFLEIPALQRTRKVLDFVDVDSDKWRQYAARASYPRRWVYTREARCLMRAEKRLAQGFDVSVLVSKAEAALFRALVSSRSRIEAVENGVDCEYFDPCEIYDDPYPHPHVLVFTGAMDYAANVDAVVWFAKEVFPRVREVCPKAAFYVVGSNPTLAVRRLADRPGVVVTGRVPDIRPYLAYARAAVAPLRLARGIQNKVLEALAMDRPVLATPQAIEGLHHERPAADPVSEDASVLAVHAISLLSGRSSAKAGERRAFVKSHYSWRRSIARMVELLGNATVVGDHEQPETVSAMADVPPLFGSALDTQGRFRGE